MGLIKEIGTRTDLEKKKVELEGVVKNWRDVCFREKNTFFVFKFCRDEIACAIRVCDAIQDDNIR
jgi:hypothetical protein